MNSEYPPIEKEDEISSLRSADDQLVSDWDEICKTLDRFFFAWLTIILIATSIRDFPKWLKIRIDMFMKVPTKSFKTHRNFFPNDFQWCFHGAC